MSVDDLKMAVDAMVDKTQNLLDAYYICWTDHSIQDWTGTGTCGKAGYRGFSVTETATYRVAIITTSLNSQYTPGCYYTLAMGGVTFGTHENNQPYQSVAFVKTMDMTAGTIYAPSITWSEKPLSGGVGKYTVILQKLDQ